MGDKQGSQPQILEPQFGIYQNIVKLRKIERENNQPDKAQQPQIERKDIQPDKAQQPQIEKENIQQRQIEKENGGVIFELTMPALIFFELITPNELNLDIGTGELMQRQEQDKINYFIQMKGQEQVRKKRQKKDKKIDYFIKMQVSKKQEEINQVLKKYKIKTNNAGESSLKQVNQYKGLNQHDLYTFLKCKYQDYQAEFKTWLEEQYIDFIKIGHQFIIKEKDRENLLEYVQKKLLFQPKLPRSEKQVQGRKDFFAKIYKKAGYVLQNSQAPATPTRQLVPSLEFTIGKIPYEEKQAYTDILQTFIEKIKYADFSNIGLFFSSQEGVYSQFQKDLLFLCDNWNIYGAKIQEKLQWVQNIIDFKVNTITQFATMYPNVTKILKKIEAKNQYTGARKYVMQSVSDDITDTLYIHFMQQLEARVLRHSPFYIKDQKTGNKLLLADFIADKPEYNSQIFQNSYWQDIFSRAKIHMKQTAASNRTNDDKINSDQKAMESFLKDIGKERLIDLRCISCCPIFYTEMNIFDPMINKTPMELIDKITRLADESNNLRNKICYLLNNEGGVILFDVVRKYRDYIPLGEIITKKDQQSYIQKLESIVETISPKPQIGQNIEITFVPIVRNPMTNLLNQKKQVRKQNLSFDNVYYQRPYLQGMFVTRIKVKPTTPWKTYYWSNGDKIMVPQKVNSLTFDAMDQRKISYYMKEKFFQHYIPQDLSEQEKQERQFFAPRVSCFHPGKCTTPDAGNPLFQQKNSKKAQQNPEVKYNYMSLLIARKSDHQTIKERLRKRGIECEIVNLYKDQTFKAANNSAAIYHNARFDHLLSQISYNRDFQFGGKYAMVVYIAEFIKLPDYSNRNYMSYQSFKNLQSWVKKYHPNEQIKFWRYDTGSEEEFYLQTQSKMSTILMYYVMSQYGEKAIFKNPRNYDRLTEAEKEARIKVFYPYSNLRPQYNQSNAYQNIEKFQLREFQEQISDEYFQPSFDYPSIEESVTAKKNQFEEDLRLEIE